MDTSISIRTTKEIRRKVQRVFTDLGISTSAGVNLFLRQVIAEKGLPFTPTIDPKKLREKWDKEVEESLKTGKRYKNAKDLFRDLNE